MEEIAIFDVLRRHVYLIGALCIATTLAGYGISFFSPLIPEKYDASAIILVRPHDQIKIEPNNASKEFLDFPVAQTPVVETASKTYIQIIQSTALLSEVVRELKLDQKPPKSEIEGGTVFEQIYSSIKALYDDIAPYLRDAVAIVRFGRLLKEDPFTKAVKDVSKGLVLKSYEDTYVFEIKYSDSDPQMAADVANAIARLFIEFMEEMRSSEARDSADHLKSELEKSRQRLTDVRQRLRDYKESHQTFLYQPEYDAKLRVISDLTVELAKLDESLAASRDKREDLRRERASLLKVLDERRAELATLPAVERELQLRQADVDVANTTYGTVAKELKDAEIKSDPVAEARLISAASVPGLPSHPRRGIIVLASLLTGLLVGVALAFFLEYINRTVRGINDIEDFVGLKVIGTIPIASQRHII
jgi:tyrosine-protein kinase Etk/Wzc